MNLASSRAMPVTSQRASARYAQALSVCAGLALGGLGVFQAQQQDQSQQIEQQQTLAQMQAQLQQLKGQNQNVKVQVETASLAPSKTQTQTQTQSLEQRENFLQITQDRREQLQAATVAVQGAVPSNVQLHTFKWQQGQLLLEGVTVQGQDLSQFLNALTAQTHWPTPPHLVFLDNQKSDPAMALKFKVQASLGWMQPAQSGPRVPSSAPSADSQ